MFKVFNKLLVDYDNQSVCEHQLKLMKSQQKIEHPQFLPVEKKKNKSTLQFGGCDSFFSFSHSSSLPIEALFK